MQLAGMAGDTRESLMMYLDFEVAEDRRLCVRLTRAEVEDIVTKYTRLMAAPARGARTDTEHYQGGMWWRALTKMGEVVRRVTGGNVS